MCSTHGKDCPVCLGNLFDSKRIYLRCKHAFHKDCVAQWLRVSSASPASCPMCRAPIVDEIEDDSSDPQYIPTYRNPTAVTLRIMNGHNRRESWMAASARVAEIIREQEFVAASMMIEESESF